MFGAAPFGARPFASARLWVALSGILATVSIGGGGATGAAAYKGVATAVQIANGGAVSGSMVRNLALSATLAGGGALGLATLAGTVTNLMTARLPAGRSILAVGVDGFRPSPAPVVVTITPARKFD